MSRNTLIMILALLIGAAAWTQDLDAIQQRMAQRLDAINALKREQVVGENNRGFLEYLPGKGRPQQDVVNAENEDRKTVYEAIAARTGADAETVGRRRAAQIAQRADSGTMIQDVTGAWSAKR